MGPGLRVALVAPLGLATIFLGLMGTPSADADPHVCVGVWLQVDGGTPITKQIANDDPCPPLPPANDDHPCPDWVVDAGPSDDIDTDPPVSYHTQICVK